MERFNFAPARWIWLPAQRTLPNTFVMFRHAVSVKRLPERAQLHILADSRYTLANAQLFEQNPAGSDGASVALLGAPLSADFHPITVDNGLTLRYSYPPNQFWRHMALAAAGRVQVLLDELRWVWAESRAVKENNTLPEFAGCQPDSLQQWCHGSSSPMNILLAAVADFRVTVPGGTEVSFEPQLGDLPQLTATFYTQRGKIDFYCGPDGDRKILRIALPFGVHGRVRWSGQEASGSNLLLIVHSSKGDI